MVMGCEIVDGATSIFLPAHRMQRNPGLVLTKSNTLGLLMKRRRDHPPCTEAGVWLCGRDMNALLGIVRL
jgi:hypothetical protein